MNPTVRSVLCWLISTAPLFGQQELVGTWDGALSAGGREVRTVVHLALDPEGNLVGTVDSPEQGAFGFGLSEVEFAEGKLSFRVPATQALWEGGLAEGGAELVGIWKQRGAELELKLKRLAVDPLVGSWRGILAVSGAKIRLEFHVGTRADGSLGASMASPDQSSQLVPVDAVEVQPDGVVTFEVKAAGAVYKGKWDREQHTLTGHLLQGGVEIPLNLERTGPPPKLRRPQTPEPPFPYDSEDVRYENAEAGIHLAGTLTFPSDGGPFPAAILITGSGAQDRDETIFEHKPFMIIADHLTRRGVAVLRVDDRGVGGSGGSMATSTSADFVTDVLAGIEFLKSRGDIDAGKIGLIGHSEGGMIGPMVACETGDVAFVVMLAGPGIPGDQILFKQAALIAEAAGAAPEAVEANRKMQAELFAILREEEDPAVAKEKLREVMARMATEAGQDPEATALQVELAKVSSPWFRFFVLFDPAPVLREVACPVLAVNGSLDLQVPADEDLAGIAAALAEAGNLDYTVRSFDGLNHLFQHTETGSPGEYGLIEETFSVEVLDFVADWICERFLES